MKVAVDEAPNAVLLAGEILADDGVARCLADYRAGWAE